METCPSCGKDSPSNSLHCVHCGAKLASAAQKTQFGMPVLRPGGESEAKSADDGEKSTAEYAPQDLARLAMTTKKTPGSALAGLGSLKTGRRPGSLLQGLPQFRGSGQSPLTSGEFRLGSVSGESSDKPAKLGLYAGAKRSSLPPEVAPNAASNPPEEPPPTVAMQGVTDAQVAASAEPAEPDPTVAMQGVTAADTQATASDAPQIDQTVEELAANVAPRPTQTQEGSTDAAAPPESDPPLPEAMRGSERAHHPRAGRGVQQARIDEPSGGSAKWIIIALLVAAGVGVAIWLTQG